MKRRRRRRRRKSRHRAKTDITQNDFVSFLTRPPSSPLRESRHTIPTGHFDFEVTIKSHKPALVSFSSSSSYLASSPCLSLPCVFLPFLLIYESILSLPTFFNLIDTTSQAEMITGKLPSLFTRSPSHSPSL